MNKHVKGQKKSLWPTYEFKSQKVKKSTHLSVLKLRNCEKATKFKTTPLLG